MNTSMNKMKSWAFLAMTFLASSSLLAQDASPEEVKTAGFKEIVLGGGGVYVDPTACLNHLPLSFGGSAPSQTSTWLPAISSATPHHGSASNRSRVH